jgi:hypothetical protein
MMAKVDKAKDAPAAADDGRGFESLMHQAESAVDGIRFAKEGVERRRNETLMFGGGALVVLMLGGFLFTRGRRAVTVPA